MLVSLAFRIMNHDDLELAVVERAVRRCFAVFVIGHYLL